MSRSDIARHLGKIEQLVKDIDRFVPAARKETSDLRADLAGLIVVAATASYETCVKEIIINFANSHHVRFGEFASNNYKNLNSRISIKDLRSYAKLFGSNVGDRFNNSLSIKSKTINERLGQKIESHYENILSWRHAFAHSWARNTTVEEAIKTHRFAIRVIYAFDEALNKKG
jgi:hypothetical protein